MLHAKNEYSYNIFVFLGGKFIGILSNHVATNGILFKLKKMLQNSCKNKNVYSKISQIESEILVTCTQCGSLNEIVNYLFKMSVTIVCSYWKENHHAMVRNFADKFWSLPLPKYLENKEFQNNCSKDIMLKPTFFFLAEIFWLFSFEKSWKKLKQSYTCYIIDLDWIINLLN